MLQAQLADDRLPRVPFKRLVRVRSADGRGTSRRLWAMNLSTGGMFIRSADPLPVGARIRIEVEWASTVIPLADGEVVWIRSTGSEYAAGFGLRFTRMDSSTRSLIDSLVQHGGECAPLRDTAHSRTKTGEVRKLPTARTPAPASEPAV
jgi:uncharacterized protein (TIGR02266 family)